MKHTLLFAIASLALATLGGCAYPDDRYTVVRGYDDQPCRTFTVNADVEGRPEKVAGLACPQSDGTWKIMR